MWDTINPFVVWNSFFLRKAQTQQSMLRSNETILPANWKKISPVIQRQPCLRIIFLQINWLYHLQLSHSPIRIIWVQFKSADLIFSIVTSVHNGWPQPHHKVKSTTLLHSSFLVRLLSPFSSSFWRHYVTRFVHVTGHLKIIITFIV